MTPSSAVASLFFFCLLLLLLPAQHGASSHASYKLGSRQVFFKTPGRSPQASAVPTATSCSSIATGTGNKKLPVVHRQSPCSPLHGLPSLTAADVLRRDTSRIRRRFASQSSGVAAPASAPPPAATIIPVNGSSDSSTLPGELDYSVLVGYGTPEQQFPMFLDTMTGTTLIKCKPCASVYNCDPAFDTSRSSTFTHVLCGSPDCPTNCSGGSVCPFGNPHNPIVGTFAQDVLKLTPSTAVDDFRFVCMDVGPRPDLPEAGFLDLTRDLNSLPSRLSSPPGAFSYCLTQSPSSQGFLSLGGNTTVRDDDNRTAHAPLVSNGDPELAIMYFIDVVGMSLGGEDLPIPPGTFGSNASTNLDVGTTFTMLAQDAYTPLRDAFKKQMSQYNRSSPGFAGFDTCFNFTGLQDITIPLVRFKFGNGESLLIDGDQMLYYDDPTTGPFTMACLAFTAFDDSGDAVSAVIGTYTLASTEVVYDVAGGKVGFIPWSC